MSSPLPPKSKFGCLNNGNINTQNSAIDFGFFIFVTNHQLDFPVWGELSLSHGLFRLTYFP